MASNVNFNVGGVATNAVLMKVGVDGKVGAFVKDTTHLVIDVNGYFTN